MPKRFRTQTMPDFDRASGTNVARYDWIARRRNGRGRSLGDLVLTAGVLRQTLFSEWLPASRYRLKISKELKINVQNLRAGSHWWIRGSGRRLQLLKQPRLCLS